MGKQVTFFMTHEDEKSFLDAIRQFGPLTVVHSAFVDESEMEVRSFQAIGALGNDANLALVNGPDASGIKHEFFPTSGTHCLDLAESEVVQFSRCKPVKTWLANGRLWLEENSSKRAKSPAFLKWANALFKWVHANYTKNDAGHFVGPNALELAKAGKLQLGPPMAAPLSLEERKRILGLQ